MPIRNSFYTENSSIGEIVRKMESDFVHGTIHDSEYVDFTPSDDINRIYAYLDSKHTTGDTDSLDREKPFFNIVLAVRNIWYRATDIDRRNIKLRSTKIAHDLETFLAKVHLQEWMRREHFGMFLNAWGINSAGFNESVLKFVEQDGRLIPMVIPWNRIICDFIDFKNNPKIELLELTPAQLRKRKGYDKELVDKLCESHRAARETVEGRTKDQRDEYIRLYEIHGEFPLSHLTGKESDDDDYAQQMYVLSFIVRKDMQGNNCYDDYVLYCGREEKDPYMCTALLPEVDGSIKLRGSVKTLFDAQWMVNHSVKAMKDQLDLSSKMIFQTADKEFVGNNVLTNIETGQILVHETNQPLTLVNNDKPSDQTALRNYGTMWKQISMEIGGISESMLGANPPSGQAWRQTNALLQENHSLFELMTENKALAIEEMLREYILPFQKKKMDTADEIAATLADHDIQKIDARYIKFSSIKRTNTVIKELLLNGITVNKEQKEVIRQAYEKDAQETLQMMGSQRFFKPDDLPDKTWKELFKDVEWDPEVDITNESLDKEALETINTLLTLMANPATAQVFQTPRGKFLFNKALQLTGTVSPIEISAMESVTPPQSTTQNNAPAPTPQPQGTVMQQ